LTRALHADDIPHLAASGPEIFVRLMVIVGQLGLGGTERHLAQALPRLRDEGIDVVVFSFRAGGAIAESLQRAGVPVLAHRTRADGWRGLLQAAALLVRELRARRPDIVHFFLPGAYLVGALCSAVVRTKRVMSRRSLAHYQARYPGVRAAERLLHRRMDAVLANSRAVAAELLAEGVPPERLGLIHNGVAIPAVAPGRAAARARLSIADGALVMVCIANLIPYKGHRDLLSALERIRDRLPGDWLLLLVGRDDGIGAALQSQAARAGIASHIRWVGSVGDVADYLAAADIGVLASHEEGFSNAILEGMSAGLPMVVTDVGGNAEAVVDGDCGRVVPAHAPAELGAALLEFALDPARRTACGERARARAAGHFSEARCIELYRDLYSRLARGVSPAIPPGAELDLA
jgi:glycosyltransferase involved in cell wall biosynthesis